MRHNETEWVIIEKTGPGMMWTAREIVPAVTRSVEKRISELRHEGREIGVIDLAYAKTDQFLTWPKGLAHG